MIDYRAESSAVNRILTEVEKGRPLSREESKTLLGIDPNRQSELFTHVVEFSRRKKAQIFQGEVYPIVPLYVSSICKEHCLYCNFRSGNKDKEIQRVRLSDQDLRAEVEYLVKRGLRVIELVYATDPLISVSDISRHIQLTREILCRVGGGMVGINARPFSEADYKGFKEVGLDFVVLWQETFDEARYKQLHPGNTEKTDFSYRLTAHERMLEAGIGNIGLGILLGLTDWRNDWCALIGRTDLLTKKYEGKIKTLILGIPRLKSAAGALLKETEFVPTDREYLLAISVFNLVHPSALPFVNTRERWEVCLETALGGGVLFTFDCKTIPGGYALGRSGYQFPTYNFSVEEYKTKLSRTGLNPVFGWSFEDVSIRKQSAASV